MRPTARNLLLGVLATSSMFLAMFAANLPASADDMGEVTIAPGQTVEIVSDKPQAPLGTPAVSLIGSPAQCSLQYAATCDVYYLNPQRDLTEGAQNFIVAQLDWDPGAQFPDLALVVAGLGLGYSTDYQLYLWEEGATEGTWERRADVSGGAYPQILGFLAEKDRYALVVQLASGPSLGYELTLKMSNELFESPFESLDPALRDRGGFAAPVDRSSEAPAASVDPVTSAPSPSFSPVVSSGAADLTAPLPAPASIREVAPDTDFAGFRGSVDDQLDGGLAAAQPVSSPSLPDADPPATFMVLFWLLLVPVALALLLFAAMRRRRPAALAI